MADGACSKPPHFYPRPPRGGRLAAMLPPPPFFSISIHALREEGDNARTALPDRQADFYPRPPRGGRPCTACMDAVISCDFYPRPPRGGRLYKRSHVLSRRQFLSTPSARRATDVPCDALHFPGISIHALREEGDSVQVSTTRIFSLISIHALREEGDGRYQVRQRHFEKFLSTPSARRATDAGHQIDVVVNISIHALREEGDVEFRKDGGGLCNFYPRPPRGGRHDASPAPAGSESFLSTPSARRATGHRLNRKEDT